MDISVAIQVAIAKITAVAVAKARKKFPLVSEKFGFFAHLVDPNGFSIKKTALVND